MKTPQEMTAADYARLGLKAGLEVHTQLDTRQKLFCRCPVTHYSRRYDAEILRHMRPTLSEMGEYDPTALMEFKTRKNIIYRIARETVCTYEMDDAPPFELNPEALDIAMEITLMLGCKVVGELHIARKQYLDGSIPTGFQRTTILGVDGSIPFGDKTIEIIQLGLEEDSCREVQDSAHNRVYMTDRLSIPLIEVVTGPNMHTPQEVAEVGEIVRRLTRATGRVRRGAGSARQDVNVSINGGERVEVKGVPSIKLFPAIVHYEALRQRALLHIRSELLHRDLTPENFNPVSADVTNIVRHTNFAPIRPALERGGVVYGVRLPRFGGILRHATAPGFSFDRELKGRVRVIACLDGEPNLCHDDNGDFDISSRVWNGVHRALGCEEGDAAVLVWGPEIDVALAATEIGDRCREAIVGVPKETRQWRADGTSRFERVLPGPHRMYPDTDLPPIELTPEYVADVRSRMAPLPWEAEKRYRELGLNDELIRDIERSGRRTLFERVIARKKTPVGLVAAVVGQGLKATRRRWAFHLDDDRVDDLFRLFEGGHFTRDVFPDVLVALGHDPELTPAQAAAKVVGAPVSKGWEAWAEATLEGNEVLRAVEDPATRHRAAMGILMEAGLRGHVDGREVAEWLRSQSGFGENG